MEDEDQPGQPSTSVWGESRDDSIKESKSPSFLPPTPLLSSHALSEAHVLTSSPSRSHPKVSFEEFNAEYNLQGILARGTFSVVRKALARTTQEMVAIKIVDTTKFPASTKSVQREIEALTMVSETALCRSLFLRSR